MNNFILIPLFFIFVAGYILGILPIWFLIIPMFALPFILFRGGFGIRGIETFVFLIVGGLIAIFVFPQLFSQLSTMTIGATTTTTTVTQNSTTTEETIISPINAITSSTTAWTNGVTTIFIFLLPVIIMVSVFYHFIGGFMEDYTDDTGRVHIGRTYKQYGYDYNTEQSKFERDILDMDKIFRSET